MKTRTRLHSTVGIAVTSADAAGAVTAMRASAVVEQVGALGQQLRDGDVHISALQHEKGRLRQKGRFEIAVQPGCDTADADATSMKAMISTRCRTSGCRTRRSASRCRPARAANWAPSSSSVSTIGRWSPRRARPAATARSRRRIAMPELAKRDGTGSLKIAASSGCFTMRA